MRCIRGQIVKVWVLQARGKIPTIQIELGSQPLSDLEFACQLHEGELAIEKTLGVGIP